MEETWAAILNFPYEVSDAGNVRRIGRGNVLKPKAHTNGYRRVSLGAGNDRYVHRLVCEAFHGPSPNDGWHADHINGNRSDNRLSNLRWMSPHDNRALRKFQKGEGSANAKLTEEQVRYIRRTTRSERSDREMASGFGVSRETVRDIRKFKGWKHVE